jgi:hypothetical protein
MLHLTLSAIYYIYQGFDCLQGVTFTRFDSPQDVTFTRGWTVSARCYISALFLYTLKGSGYNSLVLYCIVDGKNKVIFIKHLYIIKITKRVALHTHFAILRTKVLLQKSPAFTSIENM